MSTNLDLQGLPRPAPQIYVAEVHIGLHVEPPDTRVGAYDDILCMNVDTVFLISLLCLPSVGEKVSIPTVT